MAKTYVIYTYKYKGDHNYMVGETELRSGKTAREVAKDRVSQYLFAKKGVSAVDYTDNAEDFINDPRSDFKIYTIPNSNKSHIDTDFRKFILANYKNVKAEPKTEILLNITREIIDEAFINWQSGDVNAYRTESYNLYSYQREVVDEAKVILNNRNRCLIHLSTRGGKSLISLKTALELGAKNILIVTPFPSAIDSFRSTVVNHTMFTDWKFYNKSNTKDNVKYDKDHNVILLSWQIFDTNKSKAKLNNLFNQVDFDFIIIDETHHTSSSKRSDDILKIINPNNSIKEIHLSGTPYNDILSERFSKDETVTLDFIDLLTRDKDKKHKEVGFPDLSIFNVCNMEYLNRVLKELFPSVFDTEQGFTLRKAFATEPRTRKTLEWIFKEALTLDNVDSISEVEEESRDFFNGTTNKHILMFVPSIDAGAWTEKYMKRLVENSNGILGKYKVIAVSKSMEESDNDYDTSSIDLEKEMNKFEEENEYTIIISCAKLTTGVTLKRCDCILLLKNCSSAETFIQILFRCMTPNKDKKFAALYNFDSEAMLKVVKETIRVRQENNAKTDLTCIRELFNIFNMKKFWADESFDFDMTDPTDYLQAIRELPVEYHSSEVITNFPTLTADELEMVDGINLKNIPNEVIIAKGLGGGVKQKTYKQLEVEQTTSQPEMTKKEQKEYEKKIQAIYANLDWIIITENVRDVNDLMNNFEIQNINGEPKLVRIND